MESFLAGRSSVSKTRPPGVGASTPVAASAPAPVSGMNMDAFESLFAPPAAANPSAAAGALADAAAGMQTAAAGGDHGGAPSVELVRGENGAVTRVIVTCGCGERIELACDY